MTTADPHVLLEMSDEPDCRFVAAWLTAVAEAQTLWSQALQHPQFHVRIQLLQADGIANLAASALEILGELEHQRHVASLDLYKDEDGLFSIEFGILTRLGFFFGGGPSYWMVIPEVVSLSAVKQAALDVLSTAEDLGDGNEIIQPERQLHTLPAAEAETWRSKRIRVRRFDASTDYGRSIQ